VAAATTKPIKMQWNLRRNCIALHNNNSSKLCNQYYSELWNFHLLSFDARKLDLWSLIAFPGNYRSFPFHWKLFIWNSLHTRSVQRWALLCCTFTKLQSELQGDQLPWWLFLQPFCVLLSRNAFVTICMWAQLQKQVPTNTSKQQRSNTLASDAIYFHISRFVYQLQLAFPVAND